MNHAKYVIVQDDLLDELPLVIRDAGTDCRSVTNDAEHVVGELVAQGRLPPGRRLLYYDSDGELTEIIHAGGMAIAFGSATEKDLDG